MKRMLLIGMALFSLVAANALAAGEGNDIPAALTLQQAREIALRNYPQLRAEEYSASAAKQNVKIARSSYLPQVTGNAARVWADSRADLIGLNTVTSSSILSRGTAGVGVSQLITDFGRTNHLVDAAKAEAEAQAAKTLSERDLVLFNVTSAYYNVLRAQKVIKVAESTQSTRRQLLDQIISLRHAKMKSDLDVGIAKQSASVADQLVLQAQNDLDDAQTELARSLGYEGSRYFVLADDVKALPPPPRLEPLVELAKSQSPELQAMRAQLNAARKQVEADRAANYPTVSALGVAGANPIHDDSLDSNYAAAGIAISIPFYTGGRIEATEHHAAYEAQALEQDVQDKENQLAHDVRVSWNDMQTAYKNIAVSDELRKTSNDALELTRERYSLGDNSIVDVAQVQLSQTQAEIAYSNATYAYLIDRALLEYKIGSPNLDEAAMNDIPNPVTSRQN